MFLSLQWLCHNSLFIRHTHTKQYWACYQRHELHCDLPIRPLCEKLQYCKTCWIPTEQKVRENMKLHDLSSFQSNLNIGKMKHISQKFILLSFHQVFHDFMRVLLHNILWLTTKSVHLRWNQFGKKWSSATLGNKPPHVKRMHFFHHLFFNLQNHKSLFWKQRQ